MTATHPSTAYNVVELLLIGLFFHIVFIGSVFDCYFTSPVVHGMQSYHVQSPSAKRLVLIIGDGLRADLLFQKNGFANVPDSPDIVAPYLRSIAMTRGAFGVSHTRVPTESRPGHVAIIGGMYEDVSAVTKGWKTNPVDFDSVFNQSSVTFSFGSPDIIPMFSHGAAPGRVRTWCYSEKEEDFTKDATALDTWVLDELRTLLRNSTQNATLDTELRSGQVVFFLHLLGLDTTGHSYGPHSKEYMENIRVVDNIVREVEGLFAQFYGDDETSFIFTADHGMSEMGNHGDGDPDNTRTPLVAWGKGIRGPVPDAVQSTHDEYSTSWDLTGLYRRDVEQADIASIMSSLLGIDWPVNSVGVLPEANLHLLGYLNHSESDQGIADAVLVNAKVILEHYRVQHIIKQSQSILYQPFRALEGSSGDIPPRIQNLATIEQHIADKEWPQARELSQDLIQTSLDGLYYLQTYQRTFIRTIVTFAYLGWIAYSSLFVFRPLDNLSQRTSPVLVFCINIIAGIAVIYFSLIFALEKAPWSYYLYVIFPCYFWRQFLTQILPSLFLDPSILFRPKLRICIACSLAFISLLVMVIGYTQRYIWSVGLALIGVIWPITWKRGSFEKIGLSARLWPFICIACAVFPLLDVHKSEDLALILLGGALMLIVGFISSSYITPSSKDKTVPNDSSMLFSLFVAQLLLIFMSMRVCLSSIQSLQAKNGLPRQYQIFGWIALVLASLLPACWPVRHRNPTSKILMFFLAFCPCFILLSISIEGLFYVVYSAMIFLWVAVEVGLRRQTVSRQQISSKTYEFQLDDLRLVLFFLLFVQVGFFGTGNVASISSFYLAPVYRLVPVFNPFLMASLLIFKIMIPYVILSINFAALNHLLHLPPFSLFRVSLVLTDVMTLAFFYRVVDTGSWLEIGQTISFFCISSLLQVFSGGICAVGEFLMADVLVTLDVTTEQKNK